MYTCRQILQIIYLVVFCVWCSIADCFYKMRQMVFALADYQQALELCPSDWSLRGRVATVQCHLGVSRYEKRAYRESVEHFTAAIECNPGLSRPYACRAQVLFLMKVTENGLLGVASCIDACMFVCVIRLIKLSSSTACAVAMQLVNWNQQVNF